MFINKYCFIVILVMLLTSCSSKNKFMYDVVTQKQQNIEDLESVETNFTLNVDQDNAAWKRVHLFFFQYLPGEKLSSDTDNYIANKDGTSKYIYEVRRRFNRDKSDYRVTCVPRSGQGDQQSAQRNAKSLARFIATGMLELTLLDR